MQNQMTNFVKLKNDKGEDVYSIDRLNDTLVVSPLKPLVDVFDTLNLCDATGNIISTVNLSELFIDVVAEAIENNLGKRSVEHKTCKGAEEAKALVDELKRIEENVDIMFESSSKMMFRENSECFHDITLTHSPYIPPDANIILGHKDFPKEKVLINGVPEIFVKKPKTEE